MRDLTFVHAPTRRAKALRALQKSHVAPSYRRLPHPLWTTTMTMILRLCLGVMRAQLAFYMRRSDAVMQRSRPEERASAGEESTSFHSQTSSALVQDVPITPCCSLCVWGFSAGSFVGLAILRLVVDEPLVSGSGTLGALAVSPALMAKFESIISSQTSCAPGLLKTLMSLSPRSRWSWSATMITTWTGILAGIAILIVTGSGWILCQECTNYGHSAIRGGGGKASPSVSIFSRAPLCPNTCRHCRNKPCDIATDHDDHICYNCEQRLLFPERIPKWETQKLPICDLWCQECATQRCCTRGSHQYHLCMQCERRGVVFLAPVGGEDPWAANDG